MLHLLSEAVRRDPYAMYAQMRPASPLHVEAAGLWILLDHAGVKRALTDTDDFSSVIQLPAGKVPDWLVFSDPPRHTRLRALILRAFTPRAVAALEPRVRALSRELLAPLLPRGEMDLVADYAGPLPTLVIADMLGIPAADRPRFVRWSAAIVNLSHAVSADAAAARAVAEHALVKDEMRDYLQHHLATPQDDLLHALAAAEIDGERLDLDDLLGFFQLLLSAGTETTTDLIDNAILCLLAHPEQRARLAAAPELLPAAIEEVVRYRSPLQMVFRTTRRLVELHGKQIPAGALVLVMIGAANHDPAVFSQPDRFDIDREHGSHLASHLGFGHGIHFCIGAALSRLEARVALPELLALEGLARADDRPWTPRAALLVHGPESLPLRFEPGAR